MRGTGLLFLALLLPVNARAESWKCTLLESHHFVKGRDVTQRGGGDYLIAVKPPVINLTVRGHLIIGYDIVENSAYRLFGERRYPAGGTESTIVKLTLDKVHGRIVQTSISQKGDSTEMSELINGRCVTAPAVQPH